MTIEEDVMSKRLMKLLDHALPDACPDEDFFLAGPPSRGAARRSNDSRQAALLAELRRQRRARPSVAA